MKLDNKSAQDLMKRFSTDAEFKDRITLATKAQGDEAVKEVETILKAEGYDIDPEIHKIIAQINWHSNNLPQELQQRVSKGGMGYGS